MNIVVIGAGVIGLTSAWELARRGHQVTIVERNAQTGQECSLANGAQLSYSYVAPLADPSVWRAMPRYLLDPRSPLSWKAAPDMAQWRWLAAFLRACNADAAAATTVCLLSLAQLSRARLAALQGELALDFDCATPGKLVMYGSAAGLSAAQRQVDLQARFGAHQRIVSRSEFLAIEPALEHAAARWAGAVYTASEQVGDCASFCTQLTHALQALPNVRLMTGTSVTGAMREGRRVRAVATSAGALEADAFVLANGAAAAALAPHFGLRLPLYPLKGYSITFDTPDAPAASVPTVSVTDLANKVVYARIGSRLRVAGRVELVGDDRRIEERRWRGLAAQAGALFPLCAHYRGELAPWAGLRPATPRGRPIIGATPLDNVHVNAGHGALGWTLACGSAALLADHIEGLPAAIDAAPFRYQP